MISLNSTKAFGSKWTNNSINYYELKKSSLKALLDQKKIKTTVSIFSGKKIETITTNQSARDLDKKAVTGQLKE